MKRSAELPFDAERAYRAILDPILLTVWFDVPYASTGSTPLHLFEVEDPKEEAPWKFRGWIIAAEENRRFVIEMDEKESISPPTLELRLSEGSHGVVLEAEWESRRLDGLAERFLDPAGHRRLAWVLADYLAEI